MVRDMGIDEGKFVVVREAYKSLHLAKMVGNCTQAESLCSQCGGDLFKVLEVHVLSWKNKVLE